MTAAEELAELEAARTNILTGGQEYEMSDGTRVRRAELSTIQKRIDILSGKVSAAGRRKKTLLRFKQS